ncbi:hypothetical protein Tco_1215762, partial [Tanacetum coccineum]
KSFDTLADNLYDVMVETLPTMVDKHIKEQVMKQVPEQVRNQVPVYVARQKAKEETQRLITKAILQELDASVRSYMSGHIIHVHPAQSQTSSVPDQQYQLTPAVRPRDHDDPHDDAHPEGENSAKWQKTPEYEAYLSGESTSGQVFQEEQAPSTLDDDEIPTKQVSQDIMEEVSLTINEAKLRKMADEMLRHRCTSGDEHQAYPALSSISKAVKLDSGGHMKLKAVINSATNIAQYTLQSMKVRITRVIHIKTYLLDNIRNIQAIESQILKSTCKAAI